MVVTLKRETSIEELDREVTYVSPVIGFNHAPGYRALNLFNTDTLLKEHGGKLVNIPQGAEKTPVVMGRVLDESGVFQEVTTADEAFELRHEGTSAFGRVIGAGISVSSVEELLRPDEAMPEVLK